MSLPGFLPYTAMPAFLRSLDVFVVPRHDATVAQDTTPLKPLEALASGVPVWSTDLPALRELLAGRDGTQLFAPEPGALADLLATAVDAPPDRPDGTDMRDRAWASEITRYREVYP